MVARVEIWIHGTGEVAISKIFTSVNYHPFDMVYMVDMWSMYGSYMVILWYNLCLWIIYGESMVNIWIIDEYG